MFDDDWRREEVAASDARSIWKRIWQLQTLPRIKIFAWRACQNALPTRQNIHHRIKDYNPDCSLCHRDFESIIHALKDCKFAREAWHCSNYSHVASSRMSNVVDWWESCWAEFDETDVAAIITICWAIWGARNANIMEGKPLGPGDTIRYAMKTCSEVMEEVEKLKLKGVQAATSYSDAWSVPDQGWMKMNVDAGVVGDLGARLGAVLRDWNGVVRACSTSQSMDKWEPTIAEAKAVLRGVELAKEMGVQQLVVESDCLLVI